MALFLIIGVVVGALGVEFALLNTQAVTVTVFAWSFTSPLALVIFTSMLFGILIAVIAMVPSVIREALDAYAARREARKAEQRYASASSDQLVA
jgi:uncharacterized integral membrane protein